MSLPVAVAPERIPSTPAVKAVCKLFKASQANFQDSLKNCQSLSQQQRMQMIARQRVCPVMDEPLMPGWTLQGQCRWENNLYLLPGMCGKNLSDPSKYVAKLRERGIEAASDTLKIRRFRPTNRRLDQETSDETLSLYSSRFINHLSPAADHSCASNDQNVQTKEKASLTNDFDPQGPNGGQLQDVGGLRIETVLSEKGVMFLVRTTEGES